MQEAPGPGFYEIQEVNEKSKKFSFPKAF